MDTNDSKNSVRQHRKSATCRRCKAFDAGGPECGLGYGTEYREDEFTKYPKEPCPRPLTVDSLLESPRKLLNVGGDDQSTTA